jgi:hypothetical protein
MIGFVVAEDIRLDTPSIKVSVIEGESISKSFLVTSDSKSDITLNLVGLNGVTLSEESFSLIADESKEITINFNAENLEKGVSVGSIRVLNSREEVYLPLIFEVVTESPLVGLILEIPPQYKVVPYSVGEILTSATLIDQVSGGTSEGLGKVLVEVEYFIYSVNGNSITTQMEKTTLDLRSSINKIIPLPSSTSGGDYVVSAVVNYNGSVAISSEFFSVSEDAAGGVFEQWDILLIFFIVILFFVMVLVFFRFLIKDRDKFILELRKYNSEELINQKKFLQEQVKVVGEKRLPSEEVKKEIKKEVIGKTKELKKKQEERIQKLKELKKKGNFSEMKKKLEEWKKKGYITTILDYKLSGLKSDDMKKIMNKWKNQKK